MAKDKKKGSDTKKAKKVVVNSENSLSFATPPSAAPP